MPGSPRLLGTGDGLNRRAGRRGNSTQRSPRACRSSTLPTAPGAGHEASFQDGTGTYPDFPGQEPTARAQPGAKASVSRDGHVTVWTLVWWHEKARTLGLPVPTPSSREEDQQTWLRDVPQSTRAALQTLLRSETRESEAVTPEEPKRTR